MQSNTLGRFAFGTQAHLQTPQRIVVRIGIVVEFRLDQPQNQVRLSGGERGSPFGESLGRSYRHVVERVPGQHGLPERGLRHRHRATENTADDRVREFVGDVFDHRPRRADGPLYRWHGHDQFTDPRALAFPHRQLPAWPPTSFGPRQRRHHPPGTNPTVDSSRHVHEKMQVARDSLVISLEPQQEIDRVRWCQRNGCVLTLQRPARHRRHGDVDTMTELAVQDSTDRITGIVGPGTVVPVDPQFEPRSR